MNRLAAVLVAATLLGGSLPAAHAAKAPLFGRTDVRDDAGLFTPDGIRAAEDAFGEVIFPVMTHLTVVTVDAIPDDLKAGYEKVKKNDQARAEFFNEWARELAKKGGDTGVFVLMYDDGERYITRAIADRQTTERRGFGPTEERKLVGLLNEGSKAALGKPADDARPLRDAALLKATEFVAGGLREMAKSGHVEDPVAAPESAGSSIMGWVCMGLMVVLGIWLVMGLIRAFSGGGGGYGGGGGGYGGGGFFPSLMGGLFGAAAGMYMYDQFFGDSGSDVSAGDAGGFDGGDTGDAGAGDWDGGSAGGDFGGGDWGGGGDFGGGDW